jgi:hypothetical protein
MAKLSTLLQEATRELDRSVDVAGDLYRIHYAIRNPAVGCGAGLGGVEDDQAIRVYADALTRTQKLFAEWGWKEPHRGPDGFVPVWVFHTDRLGRGDCPLTIPLQEAEDAYRSEIALRSTIDEPRADIRAERMAVDAAHEAAHTFTHRYVSPINTDRRPGSLDDPLGEQWGWFDEATAVFVEGEVFTERDYPEARRFGLRWLHCPELSLTTPTWVRGGGYFAAWFVRYLAQEFRPAVIRDIWARSAEMIGPLDALRSVLRAQTPPRKFSDVFWDYCWRSYAASVLAPGVVQSFGSRSLTASFAASGGASGPVSLSPLACRYYRVVWESGAAAVPVHIRVTGQVGPGEVRAAILTLDANGQLVGGPHPAEPRADGWHALAHRPAAGADAVLVVARVEPPVDDRTIETGPVHVEVTVGDGSAAPACPSRRAQAGPVPVGAATGTVSPVSRVRH